MNKALVIVLGLIVVALVGWYVASQSSSPAADKLASYEWQLTELPEHPAAPGVPRTGVTLAANGKTYPVGEFDGSCFVIEGSAWQLQENESSGVICWWAGGGSEVGVFNENGKPVVKVGQLDEGTAETEGFRGNFQTVVQL